MAAIDMTAQVREWVAKAIGEASLREDFAFDVRWDTSPSTIVYTVIITMPNPLLGKGPLLNRFTAPVSAIREDAIRLGVHTVMQQLREMHKTILDAEAQARHFAELDSRTAERWGSRAAVRGYHLVVRSNGSLLRS